MVFLSPSLLPLFFCFVLSFWFAYCMLSSLFFFCSFFVDVTCTKTTGRSTFSFCVCVCVCVCVSCSFTLFSSPFSHQAAGKRHVFFSVCVWRRAAPRRSTSIAPALSLSSTPNPPIFICLIVCLFVLLVCLMCLFFFVCVCVCVSVCIVADLCSDWSFLFFLFFLFLSLST